MIFLATNIYNLKVVNFVNDCQPCVNTYLIVIQLIKQPLDTLDTIVGSLKIIVNKNKKFK